MIRVEKQSQGLYYWYFEDDTTWDEFHLQLDELTKMAENTTDLFCIVAFAGKQMPRGNAVQHLKRLLKIVSDNDNILQFVIVNQVVNIVGQAFVKLALMLFDDTGKVNLVKSKEEAQALVQLHIQ